ncbi:FabD/lysophospholipase-like protein [Aaosphaeria arxii CBS 175.79]|uniref:FabD/lysophospholipase-like protein n=1 Tax=Aaosphaeria arxii CBS 175.79 TaxID=1450172 RepID=A0A6A5Y150_9PLEO|nr:FabD/lysophospholipase-like protein [Aaosphaeria arxii CBS 175.79]KAF2018530.1 FabD/lysophospholipase-like protein [Aaosphaeria arxii CBS 175.79]
MADTQPLKILSLDGGGVRGIATLYLLRSVMHQIALSTDQRPESLRPCDYFDLIAGTSTGGLIGIMLGRLRYTVEQAIEKYIALSKDIFTAHSSEADAKFDYRILEERIKQVVTEAPCPRPDTLTIDEPLKDETIELPHNQRRSNVEPKGGCRTFVVCTISRGSGARPEILRSYKTSYEFPFSGKIWEAARATSAAPSFFAPITVDHVTYGDGATGWNNPTTLVISEVRQIWPDRPIGCLVSLGTGEEDPNQLVTAESLPKKGLRKKLFSSSMPKSSFRLEVAKYCARCLTSCTRTHENVLNNLERDDLVDSYFRLNTPGIGKIGLEEWRHIDDMIGLTVDYLNAPDMKRMKATIASKIISYHSLSVFTDTPVPPELGNMDGPEQLPTRLLVGIGQREPSEDNRFPGSASAGNEFLSHSN